MKTLTVILKQHTPLIHFQHNQYGATLRASEVKPKLDRYIIEKIGNGSYDDVELKKRVKKEHESWFVKKEGVYALNYKLSIKAKDLNICQIEGYFGYNQKGKPNPAPMFFGNMEKKTEKKTSFQKKFFSKSNKLILTIVCLNDEILDVILDNLFLFFMHTNFGTRQSKGYGCFSWDEDDWEQTMKKNGRNFKQIPILNSPYFTSGNDEKKLFQEMEWFYKAIRSGINDCFGEKFYMKSLMFVYAKEKHQQWEKKTIKSVFYDFFSDNEEDDLADKINEKEIAKHPDNNDILTYTSENEGEYLFKDCLGLSTKEQWKKPIINESGILDYDDFFILSKSTVKSKKISETIQRMKSPIMLKPIKEKDGKYKVYILSSAIPDGYLGSKFYLSVDCCEDEGFLPLYIYPDFSIKDYFDFIFKKDLITKRYKVNIAGLITKGINSTKGKRILAIFNEIRENYNTSI